MGVIPQHKLSAAERGQKAAQVVLRKGAVLKIGPNAYKQLDAAKTAALIVRASKACNSGPSAAMALITQCCYWANIEMPVTFSFSHYQDLIRLSRLTGDRRARGW